MTAKKTVSYEISADAKSLLNGLRAIAREFKGVNSGADESAKTVSKALEGMDKAFKDLQKDLRDGFKNLGQSIDDSIAGAFKKTDEEVKKTTPSIKSNIKILGDALQSLSLISAAVTASIGMVLRNAVKTFADFEHTMNKFNAVSSATGSQLSDFRKEVLKLGASTKFSAQEVSDAGVELAKMGFTAEETTKALSGMVDASVASGATLEETSSIVAATMRQFGIAADRASDVGDIITKAANESAIDIRDWGESMKYIGSAAAAAGQPLTDMAALIVKLGNSGIKASMAGNSLENAILRLQKPTKDGAAILQEYGIKIEKSDGSMRNMIDIMYDLQDAFKGMGNVEKAGKFKDLFGEVALKSMQVLFNGTREELEKIRRSMAGFQGTAKTTADKMRQGLDFAFKKLKANIEAAYLTIGEKLVPTILLVSKGIEGMINAFNSIPGPIQSVIAHTALLAAGVAAAFTGTAGIHFIVTQGTLAFSALSSMMGTTMVSNLGLFANTVKGVAKVVGSKLKWLVSGPMAALVGAAAVLYAAYKTNFGGLRVIFDDFLDFLRSGFLTVFQAVFGKAEVSMAEFAQYMKGIWQGISDTMLSVLGIADQFFSGLFKSLGNLSRAIRALISGDMSWFKAEFDNMVQNFSLKIDYKSIERYREMARKKFFGHENAINKALKEQKKIKEDINDLDNTGNKNAAKRLDILKDQVDEQLRKIELKEDENEIKKNNALADDAKAKEYLGVDAAEKSVEGFNKTIGKTAQGFAANLPEAIKFQKSVQSIGLTCAATVDKILKLSGVTKDLQGVIGNVNWVPNYDKLIDAGLAERIAPKDIQAGDIIVKYGGPNSNQGHTGVAIGGGKVVHASSAYGRANGLRQLSKVDTIERAFGGVNAGNYGPGQLHGIRLKKEAMNLDKEHSGILDKKDAIEMKYNKNNIALLKEKIGVLVRAREVARQIMNSSKDADERDNAKQLFRRMESEISAQKKAISKLGLDMAKINAEAQKDAQKEIQKLRKENLSDAKKGLKDLEKDAKSMLKEITKENQAGQKSLAEATKTTFDHAFDQHKEKMDKFQQGIKDLQVAKENLAQKIDFTKALAGKSPTAKQKEEIEELEKQYSSLTVIIDNATHALRVFEDEGPVLHDKGGSPVLGALGKQIGGIAGGLKNAGKAANILGGSAVKAMNKASEKTKEAEEKTQNIKDAIDNVSSAFFELGSFVKNFGAESSQAFGTVLDGLSGIASGIARMASGDLIGGASQALMSFFTGIGDLVQHNKRMLDEYTSSLYALYDAVNQGRGESLERKLQDAEARGASPDEILGIKRQIADNSRKTAMDRVTGEFKQLLGNTKIVTGENGLPDLMASFQPVIDEFEKANKNRNPFNSGFLNELAMKINQTLPQLRTLQNEIDRIGADYDKAVNTAVWESNDKAQEAIDQQKELQDQIIDNIAAYREKVEEETMAGRRKEGYLQTIFGLGEDFDSEELRPTAEKFADQFNSIYNEVISAFGTSEAANQEIEERIKKLTPEIIKEMTKARDEAREKSSEKAKQDLEKDLNDAEAELKKRVEVLKDARADLYKQEQKPIQDLINAEETRIKAIEEQNKGIEKQIRLREKQRAAAIGTFNAADQGIFAGMVNAVDYDAELRLGLEDIHNPDGVLTGTYSEKSHKEAIEERIALMELENENALKLEKKGRDEYLKRQQEIAAIQARFADEILSGEDLTNRERLEIEQMKADAYVSFQNAYIEAINNRADADINAFEATITKNNEQATVYKENIEAYQSQLEGLRETYEADLAAVDERVEGILKANDAWRVSVEQLRDGISGPLQQIVDMYNRAKSAASYLTSVGRSGEVRNAFGGSGGGAGGITDTSGRTYSTTSEMLAAQGYSGALSNLPSTDLSSYFNQDMIRVSTPNGYNSNSTIQIGDLHFSGNYNEPGRLKKEVVEAMKEIQRSGVAKNGVYYHNTGMN